jgi:predicted RNA-binding Zn-ribbon protein involved in translation (DUF1610 family)
MGLEAFTTSNDDNEQKEHYHCNKKLDKGKLFNEDVCPKCGEEAEYLRGSEYRCKTDSSECSVIYYFANNFSDNNA